MTDMQAEKVAESVRQAFEHWFSDEGKHPNAVQRQGDGYILASAHIAWSAWQVAYTSLLTKLQAERDEALEALDRAAKGESEYTRRWALALAENERLKPFEDELRKIAADLGEPDDPFAAWETVEALRARISELEKALEQIAASDINNFDTLHPSACASVARNALKGGEK